MTKNTTVGESVYNEKRVSAEVSNTSFVMDERDGDDSSKLEFSSGTEYACGLSEGHKSKESERKRNSY